LCGSFAFALACTLLGGLAMEALVARRFGALDTVLVGLGLIVQLGVLATWARRFDPRQVFRNYRSVMQLNTFSALALGVYLVGRLILNA
jgi:hypothetical protein